MLMIVALGWGARKIDALDSGRESRTTFATIVVSAAVVR